MGSRWPIGCVALEITQRCNLDCTLCYLSEHSEAVRDIPLEEIFRRIDLIFRHYGPNTDVQITGGDPTLRQREELLAIVQRVRGCSGEQHLNSVSSDASSSITVMDFRQPIALDPPPDGWRHRRFFRTAPMQISFVTKEGRPSIRMATHNGGSMLYRYTDLSVDQYPMLGWDWFVELPIASGVDETTRAGDDHPARLYLKFRAAGGKTHAMEIIWGNRKLRAGDWKYLESFWSGSAFPHYVARGGDENVGRWHDEKLDLRALYRKHWGDSRGATLQEVALFCDTDATGARSVAYFSSVRVERAPLPQP
ncbi:MAG: DUF3047 domain-containing protein [Betaproteobacteria bacterium]|nr:DUF3047 domain-containing protein [Betaproteobacteria bacterium]